jgi:phage recombination protein Bet
MAVKNSLTKPDFESASVKYESNGTEVTLSPAIIRKYLVNGQGNVTDQEVVMFINLCKAQRLNPFLKEAYLIKYGNQPATIVTGKEVFTKRARRNKDYAGQQAGIIVQKEDGTIENRIGTLRLQDETIVGGWAKVYIKGYEVPTEITVSFDEYVGTKKDGEINSQWSKKPATMIRKVALVQALREAFPEDFQGMYSAEEMNVIEPEADEPVTEVETEITEAEMVDDPLS